MDITLNFVDQMGAFCTLSKKQGSTPVVLEVVVKAGCAPLNLPHDQLQNEAN